MRTGRLPFLPQLHDAAALRSEIETLHFSPAFSEELADLITKLVSPKETSRIGLLDIVRHPWIRGFPGPMRLVTPKPIVFFKMTKFEDVLKFRRTAVTIDPLIVAKACECLVDCDKEKLMDDLSNGIINDETTVYYLMTYPTAADPRGKPSVKPPRRALARRQSDLGEEPPSSAPLIALHREKSVPKIRRPDIHKHSVSPIGQTPRSGR
jgi:hypothetical protein